MRPPGGFVTWQVWRRFHRTVWGQFARRMWPSLIVMALYTWLMWTADDPTSRLVPWTLGVLIAALLGSRLGKLYMLLEQHIHRQIAWREIQQSIRAKMIEDGVPAEEADLMLHEMDMELDRRARGEREPDGESPG